MSPLARPASRPAALAEIHSFRRRHGTTRMLASLVTAPDEVRLARAELLAGLLDAGVIEGVHAERSFLSAARCGAQDPEFLRDGDPSLVSAPAEVLEGRLVMMTVAADAPGGSSGDQRESRRTSDRLSDL